MSAPDEDPDEFGQIRRLFRPLIRGAAEAFDLLDDAAALPARPGFDLVVTKDAIVEGVHVPLGERPDLIARKLLRANLSDLAAKAAEPYAAFLAVAWPADYALSARESFASGLGEDAERFGVVLLGGDTVSTPGPLTASLTLMGWTPAGGMVRRSGARPGDLVLVSGTIGDGLLGLAAVRGEVADPDGFLADRYRLPQPRLELRERLRGLASAAADVSDGLVADAGHIARASGVAVRLDLDNLPLSPQAATWLAVQPHRAEALLRLATGGDDYEVVCAAPRSTADELGLTVIGEVVEGEGTAVSYGGVRLDPGRGGWRHA